jgi:polysaccharide biosynthesis protein PslH
VGFMNAHAPRFVFLLDTPNIWCGRALAGTPARVLALAEHAERSGAQVTLVLCDRGAEYGAGGDWATTTLLAHPTDFYTHTTLGRFLAPADFLVLCEAEALLMLGRDLADHLGARLVYDVHDDEAALAASLGEPSDVIDRHATNQRAALTTSDHVIVSTRNEMDMARSAGIAPALLPNGADTDHSTCWGPDLGAATLVFLGNLYYAPNARAAAHLRNDFLPALRALGTHANLRLIGRGPQSLTEPAHGVASLGRVPSINDALQGATLAVAPLDAGSGAKMKVLDYLAAGLPVLGTSEAVTGLPDEHPGVIVEDDMAIWPTLARALLREPDTLRLVGSEGRQCVETRLSWTRIGAELTQHSRTWLNQAISSLDQGVRSGRLGVPRWLAEHADQQVLPAPRWTTPGQPLWLTSSADTHVSADPIREHPS